MDWPADAVERRSIASLVPYARNARTHSDEQIAQLMASIREWGWTMPVLVDETGGIIAGHGRVLAAARLGIAEVPVMIARGWSEAQKQSYVIADNKLALNAGWDEKLLRIEVADLEALGFNIPLLAFSERELKALSFAPNDGLTDPDTPTEPVLNPITRRGELWRLDRHRLLCGDSTNEADVTLALDGAKPHLAVTDPPYGVDYDPNWRLDANKWKGSTVRLSKKPRGAVENDTQADWRDAWVLCPCDVIYSWSSSLFALQAAEGLIAADFVLRSQIVWNKDRLVIGRCDYHWQHEPCWYAVRKGKAGHWQGSRTESTVWHIAKQLASETGHSTQKPVECMRRPMDNNSERGEAVYDPFVGSGTTIIAAEMTGRPCHAIEINPAYVDAAIVRWQAFTGHTAVRADGVPFAARQEEAAA